MLKRIVKNVQTFIVTQIGHRGHLKTPRDDEKILIPARVTAFKPLIQTDYQFEFKQLQFPVKVCYADHQYMHNDKV